jgi:diaminohydroxyphosphoribosylaminopyrimidine deaminase / 5-amino-6-(5-phosphoribosylamino)uracil reductase
LVIDRNRGAAHLSITKHQSPQFDEQMMRRAIRLAMNGRGRVEPNPMVAAVLVKDGRVIGEGFHTHFGGPHAEPAALAACAAAGESPGGATAYVTLEPCCHTNKKTPPCVPALIDAGISRVVVGCVDPNPDVNGKSLDILRAAGVEVDVNVLEDPAKQLLAPFIATTVYERPYVTLKWAESADGKVAGRDGKPVQITNARATRVVHEMRARCDAVMVGIGTVLCDDPLLTARNVPQPRRIFRVVLDSQLRIPMESKLVRTAREPDRVVVYHDRRLAEAERERIRALSLEGVQPFMVERRFDGLNLNEVLSTLAAFDVAHVLVESGPTLAQGFFDQQSLADRVWIFHSSKMIGEPTAPAGVPIPAHFVKTGEVDLDGDRLSEYLNPNSPLFFAAEPSADLVLASNSSRY